MAYASPERTPPIVREVGYFLEDSRGIGNESDIVRDSDRTSFENFLNAYLRYSFTPFLKFLRLKLEWEQATAHLSSVTQMSMHPAYQQIIGMGPDAVPFILAELKGRPGHWFWALRSITGTDPVPLEHQGRVKQMAEDWLAWGKSQGYL